MSVRIPFLNETKLVENWDFLVSFLINAVFIGCTYLLLGWERGLLWGAGFDTWYFGLVFITGIPALIWSLFQFVLTSSNRSAGKGTEGLRFFILGLLSMIFFGVGVSAFLAGLIYFQNPLIGVVSGFVVLLDLITISPIKFIVSLWMAYLLHKHFMFPKIYRRNFTHN